MTSAPMPWPCSRASTAGTGFVLYEENTSAASLAAIAAVALASRRSPRTTWSGVPCSAASVGEVEAVAPHACRWGRRRGPTCRSGRSVRVGWRRAMNGPSRSLATVRPRRSSRPIMAAGRGPGPRAPAGRPVVAGHLAVDEERPHERPRVAEVIGHEAQARQRIAPVVHRTDGRERRCGPTRGGRCRCGAGRARSARRTRRRTRWRRASSWPGRRRPMRLRSGGAGEIVVPEQRQVVAAADVEADLAERAGVEVEGVRARRWPARRAPRARRSRCPRTDGTRSTASSANGGAATGSNIVPTPSRRGDCDTLRAKPTAARSPARSR